MRPLIALLLLLPSASVRAEDGRRSPTAGREAPREAPTPRGSDSGGGTVPGGLAAPPSARRGAAPNAQSAGGPGIAYPEGLEHVNWTAYRNLAEVPEHVRGGVHGILRVPGKNMGVSVGFLTHSNVPPGEGRSGKCATAPTPGAGTQDGCAKYQWISERPGGRPLSEQCLLGPIGGAQPSTLEWSTGPGAERVRGTRCVLNQGQRYFCNYTAKGWDRGDEHTPKHCDTGLAAFLSEAPDP